ncbi:12827_t:CDS:2, partial [Funneliformis mosseae]
TYIRLTEINVPDDQSDFNVYDQYLKEYGVTFYYDYKEAIIPHAFSVLFLWFELLLLMRFFSGTATYINIIINILKAIWPFLMFMLMTTVAFGHAMYIILKQPENLDLKPNGDSYKMNSSDGTENLNITQDFDVKNPNDNFYVNFAYSVMGVYFWILGRWDQLERWDFWPVHVFSIAASILLVIIMQNLLVAFMTGVYENARNNVKLAVLGYRANFIADYELLEKPTGNYKRNPRYIYYVGTPEYQKQWLDKAEKYRKIHKSLSFDDIISQLSKDDDSDNDDISIEKLDEKLMKIQDEMKNDVASKFNSVEKSIKELLTIVKSK